MTEWHPGQLKHWLSLNDSGVWGDDPDGSDDVEVLRSTDITLDGQWNITEPAVRSVPGEIRSRKTLREGDLVVVTSSGSEAHLGKTAIVSDEVAQRSPCFANFVQRLRPNSGADARFIRYFLSSVRAKEEMAALGNTTTGLRNLNGALIGSVTFPGPPLAEQRAIADSLDAETARIDALIAKKQQLIDLLNERMSALVDGHFAPVGSEPTVPLARLAYVQTGVTLNAAKALEGETVRLPYLRVANVQPGWLDLSEVKEVEVDTASAARSELRPGDVLMTEGGDIDKLGRGTVWRGAIARCLHQNHVFAVRPDPQVLDSDYLANLTRTSYARAYFESTGVQSTNLASTNASKVADFRVPMLPTRTQRESCVTFERAADPLVRAAAKLRTQAILLAEHRQSLVARTVAFGLAAAS